MVRHMEHCFLKTFCTSHESYRCSQHERKCHCSLLNYKMAIFKDDTYWKNSMDQAASQVPFKIWNLTEICENKSAYGTASPVEKFNKGLIMLSSNNSSDQTHCSDFGNRSCSETFRSPGVLAIMYLCITAAFFLTVLGNLAIVVSISYFKQVCSQNNFLILSMADTDLPLDFAIMPYSMVRSAENRWYFGMTFCKVHYSFDLMLCLLSIFHLCSIAVDQFYAICCPLHYTSTMTVITIKQVLVACWSAPAAFVFGVVFSEAYGFGIEGYEMLVKCSSSCPIMFNKLWGTILFTVGLLAPSCIMIGIYVKIFTVPRRHTCELRQAQKQTKNKTNDLSRNKDRKAAMTLSIVMLGFLIC
ncbi:trace amine-associated receptor 2-like [Lathamus discolor]|uniref:trace amine-associated receptor 2-like n=1 Tax=Lathamus discolor TaxID=678569 RepID=UPI0032B82CCE